MAYCEIRNVEISYETCKGCWKCSSRSEPLRELQSSCNKILNEDE